MADDEKAKRKSYLRALANLLVLVAGDMRTADERSRYEQVLKPRAAAALDALLELFDDRVRASNAPAIVAGSGYAGPPAVVEKRGPPSLAGAPVVYGVWAFDLGQWTRNEELPGDADWTGTKEQADTHAAEWADSEHARRTGAKYEVRPYRQLYGIWDVRDNQWYSGLSSRNGVDRSEEHYFERLLYDNEAAAQRELERMKHDLRATEVASEAHAVENQIRLSGNEVRPYRGPKGTPHAQVPAAPTKPAPWVARKAFEGTAEERATEAMRSVDRLIIAVREWNAAAGRGDPTARYEPYIRSAIERVDLVLPEVHAECGKSMGVPRYTVVDFDTGKCLRCGESVHDPGHPERRLDAKNAPRERR